MFPRAHQLLVLVILGSVCAGTAGCGMFQNSVSRSICACTLDADRTVRLVECVQHNSVLRGPKHNFAQLLLTVTPTNANRTHQSVCEGGVCLPAGSSVHVLSRRGGQDSARSGSFRLGQLEARSTALRDKLWIVDLSASRIIATLDLHTMESTGPEDEPPLWATPGDGERLEPVAAD